MIGKVAKLLFFGMGIGLSRGGVDASSGYNVKNNIKCPLTFISETGETALIVDPNSYTSFTLDDYEVPPYCNEGGGICGLSMNISQTYAASFNVYADQIQAVLNYWIAYFNVALLGNTIQVDQIQPNPFCNETNPRTQLRR